MTFMELQVEAMEVQIVLFQFPQLKPAAFTIRILLTLSLVTCNIKHAPHNLHTYLIESECTSPLRHILTIFLQLFIAHSRFWLTISIRFFLLKRSNAFSNRLVVCWYFLSHLRFSREHTFSKYNPVLNTIQTRNLHENVGEIF